MTDASCDDDAWGREGYFPTKTSQKRGEIRYTHDERPTVLKVTISFAGSALCGNPGAEPGRAMVSWPKGSALRRMVCRRPSNCNGLWRGH